MCRCLPLPHSDQKRTSKVRFQSQRQPTRRLCLQASLPTGVVCRSDLHNWAFTRPHSRPADSCPVGTSCQLAKLGILILTTLYTFLVTYAAPTELGSCPVISAGRCKTGYSRKQDALLHPLRYNFCGLSHLTACPCSFIECNSFIAAGIQTLSPRFAHLALIGLLNAFKGCPSVCSEVPL